MAQRFFGPWRLQVTYYDLFFPFRLAITGSNDSDGTHDVPLDKDPPPPRPVQSMKIEVSGTEWVVDLQGKRPIEDGGSPNSPWESIVTDIATHFDPEDGLVMTVWTPRENPGGWPAGPFRAIVKLVCTSLDPDIKPNQKPYPYDFSIKSEKERQTFGSI